MQHGMENEVKPFDLDYPGKRNPWNIDKHPENYSYIASIISTVDANMARPPKYTKETKLEVFKLRDEGYTLRQIADAVGVSKSTACLWTRSRMRPTKKVLVKQPGTTKVVATEYSLTEINIGKIASTEQKAQEV